MKRYELETCKQFDRVVWVTDEDRNIIERASSAPMDSITIPICVDSEIKIKAQELVINPGKIKKAELIHAIQTTEGNTPCYGWSNGNCSNIDCCFMADCLKIRL